MESPARWKANGLPRKGWIIYDVVDSEPVDNECEWCGTSIRYLHYLSHPETYQTTLAGCICAEHLTGDYVNHKKREKELKKEAQKKTQKINKYIKSFKISKKGNFFSNYLGILVVLINKKGNEFTLKIGDVFGKNIYNGFNPAALAAYEYITKDGYHAAKRRKGILPTQYQVP